VIAVWGDELRTFCRSPVLNLTFEQLSDHFQSYQHAGGAWVYDVRTPRLTTAPFGQNKSRFDPRYSFAQAS